MEGKVPKKKVEMGRWRARYLRRRWRWGGGGQGTYEEGGDGEMGRWRARYLRRRWR